MICCFFFLHFGCSFDSFTIKMNSTLFYFYVLRQSVSVSGQQIAWMRKIYTHIVCDVVCLDSQFNFTTQKKKNLYFSLYCKLFYMILRNQIVFCTFFLILRSKKKRIKSLVCGLWSCRVCNMHALYRMMRVLYLFIYFSFFLHWSRDIFVRENSYASIVAPNKMNNIDQTFLHTTNSI